MNSLSFTSRIGADEPQPSSSFTPHQVTSDAARALALAHYIEEAVEDGKYGSAAEIASAIGVTRARISQVTILLRLEPSIQKRILLGVDSRSARRWQRICARFSWAAQQSN